jgi:hypothetical protein
MRFLNGQWEELATGLPPSFSDWSNTKLKSPMESQGLSKSSPAAVRESQKAALFFFSGGPYKQERIYGELGGLERHQEEMLCLLVMKLSSSTPAFQAKTRPPQEPIGAT